MTKAEDDLAVGRQVLSTSPQRAWATAFHAQQCAEKALKAMRMWRQLPPLYTHDIGLLIDQLPEGHTVESDQAITLTQYAVASRYVLPLGDPTPQEAADALDIEERVLNAIRMSLREEGAI